MHRPTVLVHGGWCGGWHWDPVAERLRARGLVVHTPTLTGMAERESEARAETNLRTHIDDVVQVLEEGGLTETVLVGHSYGGAVVTGAANLCPERLAAVIVLDGFVPNAGESLADILGPDFVAATRLAAERAGTPYLIPPLFGVEETTGWTGARAAAHAARLCRQPMGTAFDPMPAPRIGAPPVTRVYVACKQQSLGLFERYADAARQSPHWAFFELPSPHDAVHAMPAVVAGIVAAYAEHTE